MIANWKILRKSLTLFFCKVCRIKWSSKNMPTENSWTPGLENTTNNNKFIKMENPARLPTKHPLFWSQIFGEFFCRGLASPKVEGTFFNLKMLLIGDWDNRWFLTYHELKEHFFFQIVTFKSARNIWFAGLMIFLPAMLMTLLSNHLMWNHQPAHHRAKSEIHSNLFGWPSSKIEKGGKGDQPAKSLALHSPEPTVRPWK